MWKFNRDDPSRKVQQNCYCTLSFLGVILIFVGKSCGAEAEQGPDTSRHFELNSSTSVKYLPCQLKTSWFEPSKVLHQISIQNLKLQSKAELVLVYIF